MKIINKKGLIFGKVSIIDLLIIAVIGVALFFIYNFFAKEEIQLTSDSEFFYTFEANKVEESFEEAIEVGMTVFNSTNNSYIGEVVEVSSKPYVVWTEDLVNGKFLMVEDPTKKTVTIRIKAKGEVTETAYYAGQELIKVGHVFPIKGLGFASHGVVIDIEEVSNEDN